MNKYLTGLFILSVVFGHGVCAQERRIAYSVLAGAATVLSAEVPLKYNNIAAGLRAELPGAMHVADIAITPALGLGAGWYPYDDIPWYSAPGHANFGFAFLDLGLAVEVNEHDYIPFGLSYQQPFVDRPHRLDQGTGHTTVWESKTFAQRTSLYFGFAHRYTAMFWEVRLHFDLANATKTLLYDDPNLPREIPGDGKTQLTLWFGFDI